MESEDLGRLDSRDAIFSLPIFVLAAAYQIPLNFIDDTMICYLNSKLDLNLSCAKDFRNLISMVTWCID